MKKRIRQKWIYQVKGHSFEHPPRGNVLYESPPDEESVSTVLTKKRLLLFLGTLAAASITAQVMFWFAGENDRFDHQGSYKTDLTQLSAYYRKLFSKDQQPGLSTEVDAETQNVDLLQHHP